MKNLFFVISIAFIMTSCGDTTLTPCECYELKGSKTQSTEKKWCDAKEASDQAFKTEVKNCGIKSLGIDPDKVTTSEIISAAGGTYSANVQKSSIKWTGRKVGSYF